MDFEHLKSELFDVIRHFFHPFETKLMAAIDTLTDTANKMVADQQVLTQAVTDLTARIAAQPAGATDAQLATVQTALESVDGSLVALSSAINGLVPVAA